MKQDRLENDCVHRRRIKVGIFSSSSLEFYGGGEVTVIELANSLTSMGYDITVYSDSAYNGIVRKSSSEIDMMLKCKHSKIEYQKRKNPLTPSFLFQPLPAIQSLRENDVNLMLLYRLPSRKYLKSIARNRSAKYLFLMHGVVFNQVVSRSLKVIFYQLYLRFVFSISSILYTYKQIFFQLFCEDDRLFLMKHGITHQNTYVIPTAVDFEQYEVGRNDTTFRIIFIGRLDRTQKGISLLLGIIRYIISQDFVNVEIAIIGSGPACTEIEQIASRHSSIKYLGFVTEEDKIKLLSESNLMMVTSNLEPFSIVTVEGLASGLPVVSTPVSGPISILTAGDDFGTISSFYVHKFMKPVLDYYSKWIEDKDSFYRDKIERRNKSKNLFDLPIMVKNYATMIDEVAMNTD